MPAELTKAIPVIATDAAPIRHRRPCIPPSPLHVAGDLDVPPVARAVGAELYRREMDARALPLADAHAALYGEGAAQSVAIDAARDREARTPHLDAAVRAVAAMLPIDDEAARHHRAREIVTVVSLLAESARLDREVADVGRAIDDRTIVREEFERANVKHATAHHYAAIAVEALRRAGRLT